MTEQQPQTGRAPQQRPSAGSYAGLVAGLAALIALARKGIGKLVDLQKLAVM